MGYQMKLPRPGAVNLDELSLKMNSSLAHPKAGNYRPPSWPAPDDWPPLRDAEDNPVCIRRDTTWPLDVWAGIPMKLNFELGKQPNTPKIDPMNAELLRRCAEWLIWGRGACKAAGTLKEKFSCVRTVVAFCSNEGILASDLMRFPAIAEKIPSAVAPSKFNYTITVFHDLLDAKVQLGFFIFDKCGLTHLANAAPGYDYKQTAYIPPRIWAYQIKRLREVLDDYLKHKDQIKACYRFCLEAYAHNYGSLSRALLDEKHGRTPFRNTDHTGARTGRIFYGKFALTAERYGISALLDHWLGPDLPKGKSGRLIGIARLSTYLTMVSEAGLRYMLNFSLMRIKEGHSLRADCLIVDNDEKIGEIYILRGPTTKTDPDPDAYFPTTRSVNVAHEAMDHIARLRMTCAAAHPVVSPTIENIANPYLIGRAYEPWSLTKSYSYAIRPTPNTYMDFMKNYPYVLEREQLKVTEDDLRIALLIEPDLDPDRFKVGTIWPLENHQLRRTGAVNMLSSGMVSDSSLQYLMKHLGKVMTLYYGHNYSRLALDDETRGVFLRAMYESIGRELANLLSAEYVSPYGAKRKDQVVHFIKVSEIKALTAAAKRGDTFIRINRLGACMNKDCTFGGIEAIAHCTGTDGDDGPCTHALMNRANEPEVRRYAADVERRLGAASAGSPRQRALEAEKRGVEVYLEIIAG